MFPDSWKVVKTACACAVLLSALPLAAATRSKPATTSRKTASTKSGSPQAHHSASVHSVSRSSTHSSARASAGKGRSRRGVASAPKRRGQQSIESSRATEIQQALIREHYLEGEPTGEWDQATRNALTRLQGDNHWQTKVVPDSRALIKLGLGPSQQNLLNPESAAIATPSQPGAEKSLGGSTN